MIYFKLYKFKPLRFRVSIRVSDGFECWDFDKTFTRSKIWSTDKSWVTGKIRTPTPESVHFGWVKRSAHW